MADLYMKLIAIKALIQLNLSFFPVDISLYLHPWNPGRQDSNWWSRFFSKWWLVTMLK